MKRSLLPLLACPRCRAALRFASPVEDELLSGELECTACSARFPIRHGVPVLLEERTEAEERTQDLYADIWQKETAHPERRSRGYDAPVASHLELLRQASGRELVCGEVGIDAGCGTGGTVVETARRHPEVQVVGIDLSAGLVALAEAARSLPNAHLVQGNLLAPPVLRARFDFVYSFGVLHHTRDPEAAFRELLTCLRPGGRITLFVYKDFSDLPLKRLLLLPVTALRRATVHLSPSTLRLLARLAAPLVFVGLTLPARLLRRLGGERLARHLPYGTFPDLGSISSSLEDRFGAPYEFRYSRRDLEGWAERAGLEGARVVDCLPLGFSGLVLSGEVATAVPAAR